MKPGRGRGEIPMRKLLGLFSVCALIGVAEGVSAPEYGRPQQLHNAPVAAPPGHNVESATYTVAPGGTTGWRTGPGTTALAVIQGGLQVEAAEGCGRRGGTAGGLGG